MTPALYLFPVPLGDTPPTDVLPAHNIALVREIKHFIVEEVRTTRRWLKKMCPNIDIDSLTFYPIDKHTRAKEQRGSDTLQNYLAPLRNGHSMGLLSEAGCPAIADPGAEIVAIAQREGLRVVPLIGPSSILLSLMASGFNGQSFAFQGYLPIDPADRKQRIRTLENRAYQEDQTQIFIETPFRNNKLLKELLATLKPQTRLCIAADITCPTEFIQTRTCAKWSSHLPDLDKRPSIFLIHK